jgi:hypothetical protein
MICGVFEDLTPEAQEELVEDTFLQKKFITTK